MNDLNDWLAINAMGWFKTKESHPFSYKYFSDKECLPVQRMNVDWNPTEDIAQAMQVLETFDIWEISTYIGSEYRVSIDTDYFVEWNKSLPMAICLAAKEAKE